MTDFVLPPPAQPWLPVAESSARFPLARVFCIGRNYRWQPGEPAPTEMPAWFMKPATAVVPAVGALPYPLGTASFCHEVELVVAIGRGGHDIDPARVEAEHVWGYAVGLDMTRRDLQLAAKQVGGPWEPAKAFDASAPCTPIVPASVCGHPRERTIRLAVNGVERQRGDLSGLLWSVPELVAMLSRSVTLLPGDLVFTGTPAGVAALEPGDTVTASIPGIGDLAMTVGH
ncbi:fumarylacetoacetate hydrolase family protein [Cupriavidus agavae]|uniref:Fumarylpyruvate hydrolase n=1 Tax=Cupriavidus agavae TaxID=1001822 RepID=A0A4Q7RZN1_9BURK|nr:fumarylacetoacetate hydrolase family protein [Cupriavidus agavae]RZT39356.1 fumarylpyruvate hydrolase [Cupriavidus agavae]